MVSKKKILVNAWRTKGAIYDLIELDNDDLIACSNNKNYVSIYRYNDDEDRYVLFKNIEFDDCSLSYSLVKLENNKFIATIDNSISFFAEKNGSYIKEKEIKLKEVEKYDCLYSFIKLSNGNYMGTGLTKLKLIGESSLECEKNLNFEQPSCTLENSRKNVWVGNSPGFILVVDLELNNLKELNLIKCKLINF